MGCSDHTSMVTQLHHGDPIPLVAGILALFWAAGPSKSSTTHPGEQCHSSNLLLMASSLTAMASNPIAMASGLFDPMRVHRFLNLIRSSSQKTNPTIGSQQSDNCASCMECCPSFPEYPQAWIYTATNYNYNVSILYHISFIIFHIYIYPYIL